MPANCPWPTLLSRPVAIAVFMPTTRPYVRQRPSGVAGVDRGVDLMKFS